MNSSDNELMHQSQDIGDLYQEGTQPMPSANLDNLILSQARQQAAKSAAKKNKLSFIQEWKTPLSMAAVLVIGLGITLNVVELTRPKNQFNDSIEPIMESSQPEPNQTESKQIASNQITSKQVELRQADHASTVSRSLATSKLDNTESTHSSKQKVDNKIKTMPLADSVSSDEIIDSADFSEKSPVPEFMTESNATGSQTEFEEQSAHITTEEYQQEALLEAMTETSAERTVESIDQSNSQYQSTKADSLQEKLSTPDASAPEAKKSIIISHIITEQNINDLIAQAILLIESGETDQGIALLQAILQHLENQS